MKPFERIAESVHLLTERRPDHELDFLPAALSIIERPASPAGRKLAWTLCGLTALSILWACLGKVDVIATADGKIVPIGNSKVIQPLETGVVAGIRVADGDHVTAGQVLVDLDTVSARADMDKFASDLSKTLLEISRLSGLQRSIAGGAPELVDPPANADPMAVAAARASMRAQADEQSAKLAGLDQQIKAKTAEQAETAAAIEKLKASLQLSQQQEDLRRQLKEMEYGNKLAWLEAQQKRVEQEHELPGLLQHRDQAVSAGQALRRQREQTSAEFEKTVLNDLAAAQQKATEFEKERDKAAQRFGLLSLKAPIDGIIQQLAIHTVGGVVTPAQALMVLVPDNARLQVEAHIQNKDIGFVHAGQVAQIKVEAFNFTRYGLIDGKVIDVSKDVVGGNVSDVKAKTDPDTKIGNSDESSSSAGYVAHIALRTSSMPTENGLVELSPGMNITAEVKTGQRRVISYLLSPIARYRQESFRER
jgi:hemolysin D